MHKDARRYQITATPTFPSKVDGGELDGILMIFPQDQAVNKLAYLKVFDKNIQIMYTCMNFHEFPRISVTRS